MVESAGRGQGPTEGGAAESPPTDKTVLSANGKVILVVEDNADNAKLFRRRLELFGHKVELATSGAEALAVAAAHPPEAICCDIGLPGDMNGYDVARAIRQHQTLRHVVLVAISGYARLEDKQRAEAAGFDTHFAKPVNFQALNSFLIETRPH